MNKNPPACIHPAEPPDLDRVVELCRQHAAYERIELVEHLLSAKTLSELLFQERSVQCLVAVVDETIVGYATYTVQFSTWQARRYMYLDCLYLAESARGRGLGRELMQRVRDEARELGCQHLEWQTPAFNSNAIAFYRRLGAVTKTKERFSWEIGSEQTRSELDCAPKILGPADSLVDPYRPRPTRMTGVREMEGWKLKIYEISLTGEPLASHVVAAALECVRERTTWPTDIESKCGFVILHEGEQAVWALTNVWVNDILRQFVYFAPLSDPTNFGVSPMPGFNACVWELEVTKHERDAWVAHVMTNPSNQQIQAYLSDTLEIANSEETT